MNSRRTVTLKDIAAALGVSTMAVSTALNNRGRLSPEMRKRICETARRMGYTPNAAARSLVTRSSSFVGVLLPFLQNSFFSNIIAGIEKVAEERNFTLLLEHPPFDEGRMEKMLSRLSQHNVDGVILYPDRCMFPVADWFREHRIPVVQVMSSFPEFGDYAVSVDNRQAGAEAAKYLSGLGHQRFGLISHDNEGPELIARREGFERALPASATCFRRNAPISLEGGRSAGRRLLREHPELTAVFSGSDLAALGVVQAALELNRRIPEDLSVLGFDDLDVAAYQLVYPLSTMAQPKERIGELAAEMLFSILGGGNPESRVLQAPLIVRNTTASTGGEERK